MYWKSIDVVKYTHIKYPGPLGVCTHFYDYSTCVCLLFVGVCVSVRRTHVCARLQRPCLIVMITWSQACLSALTLSWPPPPPSIHEGASIFYEELLYSCLHSPHNCLRHLAGFSECRVFNALFNPSRRGWSLWTPREEPEVWRCVTSCDMWRGQTPTRSKCRQWLFLCHFHDVFRWFLRLLWTASDGRVFSYCPPSSQEKKQRLPSMQLSFFACLLSSWLLLMFKDWKIHFWRMKKSPL